MIRPSRAAALAVAFCWLSSFAPASAQQYVTARANLFRIKTLVDGFHPFER